MVGGCYGSKVYCLGTRLFISGNNWVVRLGILNEMDSFVNISRFESSSSLEISFFIVRLSYIAIFCWSILCFANNHNKRMFMSFIEVHIVFVVTFYDYSIQLYPGPRFDFSSAFYGLSRCPFPSSFICFWSCLVYYILPPLNIIVIYNIVWLVIFVMIYMAINSIDIWTLIAFEYMERDNFRSILGNDAPILLFITQFGQ